MIAKVIVDLPTTQTNKPFDYSIPNDFESWVLPGMRVIVPFGNRKLQGYIVAIADTTELDVVKPIIEMIDETPVLSQELIKLGRWLSQTTLCFVISAYQAMLPAVMKATYKKQVECINEQLLRELAPELCTLFNSDSALDWSELMARHPELMNDVQLGVKEQALKIKHIVNDRTTHKWVKMIELSIDQQPCREEMDAMDARAKKQKAILAFFLQHNEQIAQADLMEILSVSRSSLKPLIEKGILKETSKEVLRDPYAHRIFKRTEPLKLTEHQHEVILPIHQDIESESHRVHLLHGVTGSGKTEIYLQSIQAVIEKGKQAIVLVPEISLTPMMVDRFKGRFGKHVAVLHSGLSQGEKYDEWRKIHRSEVNVVVGARSAIFAPFRNLGVIIIDEEHETSYKQEENPRYHARDVAIYRGQYHKCPVILGSATPSLESFARAKKGVYQLATLSERVNAQAMPEVTLIDMREELRSGNRSMFSRLLFDKLKEKLSKGEQSVLFLNRRGYSTFVMCRDCGHVVQCPHCDISLTYHRKQSRLKCHYCGYDQNVPTDCPSCGSEHIRFFGSGTQKVEEALTHYLPEARVIRMDVDTTSRKGSHEKLLNNFGSGKADILLGTQMIAKGLDFPKVTLVGVLAADTMLHLPDFRASEKTFQLLTQVSGRAGRHELPGEVVVQSYTPDHYSVTLASQHNYNDFYMMEMSERKKYSYPPFYYLTLITVSHREITKVVSVTERIAHYLKGELSSQANILGPVASSIPRIKDRYRYQCMIKYKNESKLEEALQNILQHYQSEFAKEGLQISIDTNPYMLM